MRRWLPWIALAAVVVTSLVVAAAGGGHESNAARAHRLATEMRCPVCEGLSVADSESQTSKAIAADIRRRVNAGESDSDIRAYYAAKFPGILLRPENRGLSAVVWALPVVVLVAGAGGIVLALRRWRRQPVMHATDADRALVERTRHA
jgi:cytochrome c-type biogenesis protein CcmH